MTVIAAPARPRAWQTGSFAVIALTLGAVSWIAANGALSPHTRRVLIEGLSFDLLVTLPLAYYLFVARPRRQHWLAVVAVAVLGALRLAAIATTSAPARLLIMGSVEAGIIAVIAIRGRAAWRARGRVDDPLVVLDRVMTGMFAVPLAGEAVASELAVFYYSLLSWGRRPHVPAGTRAFSVHHRGGSVLVLGVLAAIALFETTAIHLFLLHWSARVAWPVFVLDFYGVLWMVAQARALVLRPILVGPDTIVLRMGLSWTIPFDRSLITEARAFAGPRPARRSTDPLAVCSLNTPSLFLRLREPVVATGLWGRQKLVTSMAVAVDDPGGFLRLLDLD